MFKQVLRGLSVIALIVMVLTACGTTATPAATQPPAPTTAPVATQPPAAAATTAPVATAAPAATQIGTAATAKWCSNVHIVFFPGGPAGGVFAVNVYNGAVQAATDLGAKVDYVWSNWDPQTMIQQFQEAAATKPDGIAVMGHPGDPSFDPLIDQAESQGIIVTSQNTELPTAQAKYAANGFGYVGAVNYDAGYALGTEAAKEAGVKAGDRAMVWGLLSQPSRGLRTQGAIDALKKAGMTVDYIEIDSATNADPTQGTATFTGYVSSHPDVKLIVTDHGGVTATVGTYLQAAGKKPGDIFMAGFDMSPATVVAIQSGYENLVIDQQEWLQGYLPILQICLTKVYGFSGLDINTGAGFVTAKNVAFIAPLANKNIR
ncbi:MAG: substrate-binding domain-containing protein [Anaerolineales bacterium]|jgi:simple sugar transport system substrate-binding protein